ncbi:MAG: hypothetical protein GY711_25170 [bacterium]|nr:hypothetical protein [bacterium]
MRLRTTCGAWSVLALGASTVHAQETIGPWSIEAVPIAATEIAPGGLAWSWINVVNTSIDITTAFTGPGIADDGYANGGVGTTVEMTFSDGAARNGTGDDLVFFDGFSTSSYELMTDHDGFVATLTLNSGEFEKTGETRAMFYGHGGGQTFMMNVRAVAIDLSDLGVPPGVAVQRVRWRALSHSVDVLGMGVLSGRLETSYCSPALPNSSGSPAQIMAIGSPVVAHNDLTLTATGLPVSEFGYFLVGSNQGQVIPPGSQGVLCLACGFQGCAGIGRFNRANEIIQGPTGSLAIDLAALPLSPMAAVQPGETWNFQCWFRDLGSNNFTDAVSILFL